MNNYFSKVGIFFFFFVIYYYEDKLALIRNIMHPPHFRSIKQKLVNHYQHDNIRVVVNKNFLFF